MSDGQLMFIGTPPDPDVNIIKAHGERWFRNGGNWVRESWCGKFPDGTTRAPWLDVQFFDLWENEGPEAARDKARYDLSYNEATP